MMLVASFILLILFKLNCYVDSWADWLDQRSKTVDFPSSEKNPYAVIVFGENNKYFCTGTIVTLEWVISAAHCVHSADGQRTEGHRTVVVVAGANSMEDVKEYLSNSSKRFPGAPGSLVQTRRSVRVEVCFLYDPNIAFTHDLVLIKVPAFERTPYVAPVALPTEAMDIGENKLKSCGSLGFGKLRRTQPGDSDFNLRSRTLLVSKRCPCLRQFEPQWLLFQNHWLCPASDQYPSTSTNNSDAVVHNGLCDGDGGAPLLCDEELRGVATSVFRYEDISLCLGPRRTNRNECGDKNNMDMYTDLCVYSFWINSFVPEYPVIDPSTCQLQFPWSEPGVDLFNLKSKGNY